MANESTQRKPSRLQACVQMTYGVLYGIRNGQESQGDLTDRKVCESWESFSSATAFCRI